MPSWRDLKRFEEELTKDFYLHHPEDEAIIGCVKYGNLLALEMKEEHREALVKALNWTDNPQHFDQFTKNLPRFKKYKTRLRKEHLRILHKSKKLVRVSPRCSVRSFFVVEWAKRRLRPIFWPDLNELIGRELLGDARIPLKAVVRRNGTRGEWSVQFDFKGWYDQLPLHKDISVLFGLDTERCLSTLPMGFRPACEVAQAISLALADHDLPQGVNVDVYIDNVRFVGDKDAVVKAGNQFVDRCKQVGAVLDSYVSVPKQIDSFLGEEYDYVAKTRKLSSKTVEKIIHVRASMLKEEELSNRQVAAIFGLIFYSAEVLLLPLCLLFDIMKWFRLKMREVEGNWSRLIPMPNCIKLELDKWLELLERNPATPMYDDREEVAFQADVTLVVDACETGWGCVSTTVHLTVNRNEKKKFSVFSPPLLFFGKCFDTSRKKKNREKTEKNREIFFSESVLTPSEKKIPRKI